MPINFGVEGGSTRQVGMDNIKDLSQEKALESLHQIRSQLSESGRGTGVLTLHNRTKEGSEMTLERKSRFQLMFQKEERLDDTVRAMTNLLMKAGQHEALRELDRYLFSEGDGNKIESSKMLEILNRNLAPVAPRLEEVRELSDIGSQQGRGSYGQTFPVKVDGRDRMLKTFDKVQALSLKREATKPNEAIGSYLLSKKHPGYLFEKVNITHPTNYLVSVRNEKKEWEYKLVSPHTMRDLVKRQEQLKGPPVYCHGIVMPQATGKRGDKLGQDGPLTGTDTKNFAKSTLKSIKGLNERGFVHHDLKPENLFFDRKTGKTTFIDTGTLFKQSENQEKHPGTQYMEGRTTGSLGWSHPRVLAEGRHGTETDLWACGVMTLELGFPEVHGLLRHATFEERRNGITRELLLKCLDIAIGKAPDKKDALEGLRGVIENPDSLVGFAIQCFDEARRPPEEWGNRERSQEIYKQLQGHPSLK